MNPWIKHRRCLVTVIAVFMLAGCAAHERDATMNESTSPSTSKPSSPIATTDIVTDPKENEPSDNLMINGGFEIAQPGDSPAYWQRTDNLVFHWQHDPEASQRGKVLRIDTDVDQKQAYAWWIERYIHNAPLNAAPSKTPTVEPKYGTIAGLDGGFYWSDFIPIKPGRAYKVYVDAKGPASKVFIRGYEKLLPVSFADESPAVQEVFREARGEPTLDTKGRPVKYRLRYRYTTWFPVGGSARWQTYTHDQPRHPTGREITEDVRFIRIALYPYWPPGEYWYDNIRVYEVDPLPDQGRPPVEDADFEEGKVIH